MLRFLFFAALSALPPAGSMAHAAPACQPIPDPSVSYVPQPIVSCPAGDLVWPVTLRWYCPGVGSGPVRGTMYLLFDGCGSFDHCPTAGGVVYVDGTRTASAMADDNGRIAFGLTIGGAHDLDCVTLHVDGVPFGQAALASTDQDGDLDVDDDDVQIVVSKLGSLDPSADFDGNGEVTAADLAIVQQHVGHQCAVAGVRPPAVTANELALAPNPALGKCAAAFRLGQAADVRVDVYDVAGRRIIAKRLGVLAAGLHEIPITLGRGDAPGLRLVRVTVGDRTMDGRVLFLR